MKRGFTSTTKTATTKPTSYKATTGRTTPKGTMAKVPFPVKARFPKK